MAVMVAFLMGAPRCTPRATSDPWSHAVLRRMLGGDGLWLSQGHDAMPTEKIERDERRDDASPRLGLIVITCPDAATPDRIALGRSATLGRDADCEVALSDPALSGRHATLTRTGVSYRVVDRGSTNGTFVDGARVTEAALPMGAILHIGKTVLELGEIEPRAADPQILGGSAALARVL